MSLIKRGVVMNLGKETETLELPIAKYDAKTKRAHLEYPDGRREYVED